MCTHFRPYFKTTLPQKGLSLPVKTASSKQTNSFISEVQRPNHLPCRNAYDRNALLIDSEYFSRIEVFNLQTWSEHSRLTLKMSPWNDLTQLGIPSNLTKPLFMTAVLKAVPKLHWFENTYYKAEIPGEVGKAVIFL